MKNKEGIKDFLKPREQNDLFILLKDSSWRLVEEVAEAMKKDWQDQIMKIDYVNVIKETTLKDLIKKQGMMHGVDAFLLYLDRWKEKRQADIDKENK